MRSLTALTLCVALSGGGAALAQNALGDGTGLDNNLRLGSEGRNAPARNFERELRLRNAIVTGQAAGGFSFRGDVGYGAVDDFRGETAEDAIFAFERDSFFSAVSGQGVRGADALQMQMQLTVGGFVGEEYLLPEPIVGRSQNATLSRNVVPSSRLTEQFGSSDPLQYRRGALRATSEFVAQSASAPVLLRVTPPEDETQQAVYTVATPLRSMTEQTEVRSERRLTDLYEQIQRIENRQSNAAPVDTAPSNRIDPETPESAHARIINAMLERTPPVEVEAPAIDPADALDAPGVGEGEAPREELLSEPDVLARLRELREELMNPNKGVPELGGDDDAEIDAVEELRQRIAADAQRLFEGGIIDVDEIAPAARDDESMYAEHMRRGQEQLAQGAWFAAEERFTSALGLRPGDPMAAVGRVHAQIGGGMFLSAGLNLQKLFRSHPELINVRYGDALLPMGERLGEIEALLLTRLRGEDDFSRGSAIVKAYLGFQAQRDAWVQSGIERAREIDDAHSRTPDTLLDVLEQAWLTGE